MAGVPLQSLVTGGVPRRAQVRTVSKHLGIDLRWAAPACDATTLARHDGRMLPTSGRVSHVLQETVVRLLRDEATHALVPRPSGSTACGGGRWSRSSGAVGSPRRARAG
ncbi:hypothetical protein [Streptomyces sp. GC420]|uniref:hypothetical protein n=1 Tax=Streptomyces sp. GC420 TaxID=2697568 RepID=UPI00141524FB|nr:hypothetical protein [Streptomyces sp. GC420]NBM19721.1 hypothetical protein [Streptomyces sp. GC420]